MFLKMKNFCVLISTIFLAILQDTNAGFLYGQPCHERNTAYLYPDRWSLPVYFPTKCVDITQFETSNIRNPPADFLRQVSMADTLYADHMNLTTFPREIVHSLPHMETLDLSGNKITKIPQVLYKIAPTISKLIIADNYVVIRKKEPLFYSPTIRTLMLSRNHIKNIYPITFSMMPNLEILYLDGNSIKCLTAAPFRRLPLLKYLHLGQNQIRQFPDTSLMPQGLRFYITDDQRKSEFNFICKIDGLGRSKVFRIFDVSIY